MRQTDGLDWWGNPKTDEPVIHESTTGSWTYAEGK
jgi:hypothetical protein